MLLDNKEIYGVIYKATDPNGKCYVGQHKGDGSKVGRKYFGSGVNLKRAIEIHGKDYFTYTIVENCFSKEELDNREIYFIEFFQSKNYQNGYNMSKGGNGGDVRLTMSEEELIAWKNKLSISQKRVQGTPEQRRKNSEAQKIAQNRPEVKKRMSEIIKLISNTPEHKKKLSDSGKIAQNRPEVKQRNADAQRGRKHNEETKIKMSVSRKGIIFTEEHRANISKSRIGKKDSEETRRKKSTGHMGVNSCANKNDEELKELYRKRSENRKIVMNKPDVKEKLRHGAHRQHHVSKNIINPHCKFCIGA